MEILYNLNSLKSFHTDRELATLAQLAIDVSSVLSIEKITDYINGNGNNVDNIYIKYTYSYNLLIQLHR